MQSQFQKWWKERKADEFESSKGICTYEAYSKRVTIQNTSGTSFIG